MAWFFKKKKNYISSLDAFMRQHRQKHPMTEDQLREKTHCERVINQVKRVEKQA